MANTQIQTYASMANLQVAAEAFWAKLSAPVPRSQEFILQDGNKNNSKEPNAIADLFVTGGATPATPRYKLIAHQDLSLNARTVGEIGTAAVANKSGFSASVFLDTVNNQYTLSIRSTEFADSIKDPGDVAADVGDIFTSGWAFAQIASMESFWHTLIYGGASTGANGVTIPSTADLLNFKNQITSGLQKINVTGYSLGGNLAEAFTELHRNQVDQAFFFNGAGTGLPLQGSSFQNVFNEYQSVFDNPLAAYPTLQSLPALTPYNEYIHQAWEQFTLNPNAVYDSVYQNPRYVLAMSAISSMVKGAAAVTVGNIFYIDAPRTPDGQMNDIFAYSGPSDTTATASSGQRHGTSRPIWYEEQPLSAWTDFPQWDWGQGHSIALLQDSLNLMAAFEKLAPTVTQDTLSTLLQASSNNNYDSLEKALDALGRFVGLTSPVAAATADNQYGVMALRNPFYVQLKAIQDTQAFKDIAGKVTFSLASSSLATTAKTDFAAFLSLNALSPLVISTSDAGAIAALKAANPTLATAWQADSMARSANTSTAINYSDNWYTDRAAMLAWQVQVNKADAPATSTTPYAPENALSLTAVPSQYFSDLASGKELFLGGPDRRRFVFGTDQADAIEGGGYSDRLYGGAGNDTLDGKGANDYLEGGSGDDTYQFSGTWGKDIVCDTDGMGSLTIEGLTLGAATANGERNQWIAKTSPTAFYVLTVVDDARSSTGKALTITSALNASNSITIQNFDLTEAKKPTGYLGVMLEPTVKVATTGNNLPAGQSNFFNQAGADASSLAGQASNVVEGTGKTISVYLSQAAQAGETAVLNLQNLEIATDLIAAYACQTGVNGRFDCESNGMRTPHTQRLRWHAQDTTRKSIHARSMRLAGQKWLGRRMDSAGRAL